MRIAPPAREPRSVATSNFHLLIFKNIRLSGVMVMLIILLLTLTTGSTLIFVMTV